MSKQTINIGASPNDGTGTPLRTSFDYTNQNFTEIYTALGGGVALPGATTQVIFNDGGTNLAGDAGLVYNKTTDALTIAGPVNAASATITGDLTVRTNKLKVDATGVGIGTASPSSGTLNINSHFILLGDSQTKMGDNGLVNGVSSDGNSQIQFFGGKSLFFNEGASNTKMTLNSTGLGIGAVPSNYRLYVSAAFASGLNGAYIESGEYNKKSLVVNHTNSGVAVNIFEVQKVGTAQFLVDSSGNVGVGVTPSAWGSTYKSVQVNTAGGFAAKNDGLVLAQNCYFDGTNWVNNRASTYSSKYDMNVVGNGLHAWYVYNASFATVGNTIPFVQAMTLDASGNLIVGNTAAASVGATGGVVNVPNSGNSYTLIGHANGSASGSTYAYFFYNSSPIGSITQNGTTGVLYNINSDYRLKESVAPLSGGLARVNALKPSIYKWKSDGSNGEGFIAHELAEVVPFAVTGEKDAVNEDGSIKSQGIDMSRIVPILVAAIKELTARVEALEA